MPDEILERTVSRVLDTLDDLVEDDALISDILDGSDGTPEDVRQELRRITRLVANEYDL